MSIDTPRLKLVVIAAAVLSWPPAAPARAEPTNLTGSLSTIGGVRVLKLWGSPYEQGYAHGHLLAATSSS